MENDKPKKRIIYYDILNILSIIAVIAMHQNHNVHGNPNYRSWNTSLIVDCICYFAVPVFCMLTGATLMNYRKKYDTVTFFKKRLTKILIPFAFWATAMFVWKIYIVKTIEVNGIRDLINAFFTNREESTYYFMFVIIGVYLMMPLLSLLTEEKHRNTLWYIVALYFIINVFIAPILKLFKIDWNMFASIQMGDYVIYAILGYLLSTQEIKKRDRILIYVGAFIGLIYRYSITFILSKGTSEVNKLTWGYPSWNAMLLAASTFLIVKELFENRFKINDKLAKVLAEISSCTFGIYLIHKIVLYYEVELLPINEYAWEWRTFGIICTYLISLALVYGLKKIPVVKNIVP